MHEKSETDREQVCLLCLTFNMEMERGWTLWINSSQLMLFVSNSWFLGPDRGGKNEGGNWLFVDSRLDGLAL